MYQGHKVVVFTPAGRRKYLEVLLPYIFRDRALIDEYHFWLNTNNEEDATFCREVAEASGGFIKVVEADKSIPVIDGMYGYSIYRFYKDCVEPDTVYVRLDDDIVFVERGAIRKLVNFRIVNPGYFLVFANIINNAICGHIHQRMGMLPAKDGKLVGYDCLDPVGWSDPDFAEHTHRCFLDAYNTKHLDGYKFNRWELYMLERFSIGCFAFLGSEFAEFAGQVGEDEEQWLSQVKPGAIGRANAICGESLVSHFAFYTQRDHLETTDILEQYRQISMVECPLDPWTHTIIV